MHRITFFLLFPLFLLQAPVFSAESKVKPTRKTLNNDPRDYWAPTNQTERDAIRYIVMTLGNEPILKLYGYQGELNGAGDRFKAVHPLNVWLEILSSKDSSSALVNVRNRKLVWGAYLKGMSDSIQEAYDGNNLKDEYIADFSKKANLDKDIVKKYVKNQEWQNFFQYVIDNVKKASSDGRYNI